jgi:hypothetical protein
MARLGGDVDATAAFGMPPIFIAAQEGHAAAIEALVRRWADMNMLAPPGVLFW